MKPTVNRPMRVDVLVLEGMLQENCAGCDTSGKFL
jgi:hypothetical protein